MKSNTGLLELGRELNRDIVNDLKVREPLLTPEEFKRYKRLCNAERIKALGLTLIQGGKDEN